MSLEARLHSPAAERNKDPLLLQLQRLLPAQGTALEIASGSGQHAAHFAAALTGWRWCPSEADARALPSIAAWCAGLPNVAPAQVLDVSAPDWPDAPAALELVFCANLLHIAAWPVCAALMAGAARHLRGGGHLLIYGPFLLEEKTTAPSNLAFDSDLRQRNPAWGLRALQDVRAQALAQSLVLQETVDMPANNLLLVFQRLP